MSPKTINPYLIRSWLIFPAIKERFIQKVLMLKDSNKPDAVIFDLEDSIADNPNAKNEARNKLLQYLLHNKEFRKKIFSEFVVGIRINSNISYQENDIYAVKKIAPHFVLLPKVPDGRTVLTYQKIFSHLQLFVILETLEGFEQRDDILKTLREEDLFAIGYEDLSAELAIERPVDLIQPNPLTHIINSCLISTKREHVAFIEGPSRHYGSKRNLQIFKRQCNLSFKMGFDSKVAIHPSQVKIINSVFNKEELKKRAKKILKQFNLLQDGTSVIVDRQQMMDQPSLKLYSRFLRLLQQ